MKPIERYQSWLAYEKRRNAIEKRWKGKVKNALSQQVRSATQHLKWNGLEDTKANLDKIVPIEGMTVILRSLYIRAGVYNAGATLSEVRTIKQKFAGFGYNEEWTEAIINYFRLNLLNKAVLPITNTTKNLIRTLLEQATKEGWGVDKAIEEILKHTKEINERRARVITRTETVRAMNVGSMLGAQKGNFVLEKLWITAKDERVRGTHRRLDGMQRDMNDIFPNGCAFPGDPNGSAKETIQCRCTLGYVPKRDANGRLIRKPTDQPLMVDTRPRFDFTEVIEEIRDELIEGLIEQMFE